VTIRESAELQVLLEGVPLPASRQELIDYAREQGDGDAASLLHRLPDREYKSLDEVGEALVQVQPDRLDPDPHRPRDESGKPPGGEAYLDPDAQPGSVRKDGPG
jgi:hypothetical protein